MSIYRYGARVEVKGGTYLPNGDLKVKAKLLESYDDGSGKPGEILELPITNFEADEGLFEVVSAVKQFVKLQGKELTMLNQINEVQDKSMSQLTEMYNAMVPVSKKITKFRDKQTALARITAMLAGEKPKPFKPATDAQKARFLEKAQTGKVVTPVSGELETSSGGHIKMNLTITERTGTEEGGAMIRGGNITLVGKKSALAGKYLYKLTKENPRREGTHGWQSWNALQDGMTYEQFIANHGGNKHLQWDIEHGFVEVRSRPKKDH